MQKLTLHIRWKHDSRWNESQISVNLRAYNVTGSRGCRLSHHKLPVSQNCVLASQFVKNAEVNLKVNPGGRKSEQVLCREVRIWRDKKHMHQVFIINRVWTLSMDSAAYFPPFSNNNLTLWAYFIFVKHRLVYIITL